MNAKDCVRFQSGGFAQLITVRIMQLQPATGERVNNLNRTPPLIIRCASAHLTVKREASMWVLYCSAEFQLCVSAFEMF